MQVIKPVQNYALSHLKFLENILLFEISNKITQEKMDEGEITKAFIKMNLGPH